jgi:hypothetical protein
LLQIDEVVDHFRTCPGFVPFLNQLEQPAMTLNNSSRPLLVWVADVSAREHVDD